MAKLSPMMEQYFRIKEQHKDHILFYRLGDFYEMFYDDAILASKELELTLTGRDCGQEERAPMCGVPYHSCEGYIARLMKWGDDAFYIKCNSFCFKVFMSMMMFNNIYHADLRTAFQPKLILFTVVSVLAVGFPIFDTLFAMTRRAARHQPIMQADRGHLHHKLIDRGFSQKQAVMILYGISAVCAAIAIFIALKDAKTLVVILFTVIVLGLLVYFVNHRWMNKGE